MENIGKLLKEIVVLPEAHVFKKTFLGIAKQPHYENVISNLYAFFFNIEEEHKFNVLFIDSLLQIIKEKGVDKNFDSFKADFRITTEYHVRDGEDNNGRIDLLFENEEGAIIIENKVFHILINPLEAYWSEINKSDENKVGIILSLMPVSTNDDNFINITHKELLTEIESNIGDIKSKNEKYVVFYKDFYNNIMNLTNEIMDEQELKAFDIQKDRIIEVSNYLDRVKYHIENQVELALTELKIGTNSDYVKPLNNINKDRIRSLRKKNNENLLITVAYNELLENGTGFLYLIIEAQNINKEYKIPAKINDMILEKFPDFKSWVSDDGTIKHIVSKKYDINNSNLANLAQFITGRLKEDLFISLFKELNNENAE